MGYLDQIESPADLKKLPREVLPALAKELRQTIIDVVSQTGGHLASSLGAVELTLAIHYVFDAPQDKIVWDVGHQSYAHKLLTGRRERFHTLRQHGGISGFTKISESPYDAFTVGHSSTSISAALGMATASCLSGERHKTVAVIGDGSLTAGIAYEGLNQAGDSDKDLIVILNDNEMSISKNVGALSSFLSRTFSAKSLQNMRKDIKEFLKSLPMIGDDVYQIAKRTEESFKTFVTPGMLFEAFNFEYFGPIDGHRLQHLIDILENIKTLGEPVLLHVMTRKGRGYAHAENNPTDFHGVGSFDVATGSAVKSQKVPTYTEVFGDTLVSLAASDKRIVAVTAAMPEGTGLTRFAQTYPDRFFDVGIAEQHGVTFAAGLAASGFKPVVAIYSTFLQRAYDQVLHDVCIEKHPVVFALDRGGIVGDDGPTHHGVFDFSYLRHLPNMVVMAPRDEHQLKAMMQTAIHHDGPVAFRYPRGIGTGNPVPSPEPVVEIGSSERLTEGDDVLIIAVGHPVNAAVSAAQQLAGKGISATVLDARFVKPLDADTILELAGRIPRIITLEENVRQGGFGSAILELLQDAGLCVPVKRLGLPDRFIEHGDQATLRKIWGISETAVIEAAFSLVSRETT
ncbi:MAG: 1-deoxy-D-xylulose-5-phosphate synthase [Deltaproteobacteria bacterium]|nr:MAG: 1-deoxy-D-xylulose-5-phosphate synthase [Deltaproteobacteria bacterium]